VLDNIFSKERNSWEIIPIYNMSVNNGLSPSTDIHIGRFQQKIELGAGPSRFFNLIRQFLFLSLQDAFSSIKRSAYATNLAVKQKQCFDSGFQIY